MDNKNIIIAVLSITAVILFTGLLLVQNLQQGSTSSIAWADTVDRGGDYVLATGAFSDTNEALYALDAANDRLNVYQYDKNRKRMVIYDDLDLRDYFANP